jgi:hypothetical protein
MKRENIIVLIVIVVLSGLFSYFVTKYSKRPHCSYVVFIEGKLGEDADQVQHYSSGVTHIKYCNGRDVHVPTYRLIKIVEK